MRYSDTKPEDFDYDCSTQLKFEGIGSGCNGQPSYAFRKLIMHVNPYIAKPEFVVRHRAGSASDDPVKDDRFDNLPAACAHFNSL